jgi:hypothetical protein
VFSYQSPGGTADGLYCLPTRTSGATRLKAGNTFPSAPPVSTGNQVFFLFESGGTESLWSTEGTQEATREVIHAGSTETAFANSYHAGDGVLFFVGPLDGQSYQIFVTNGLPGAERQISNFPPSTFYGWDMTLLRGRPLFAFSADDTETGEEPWIIRSAEPEAVADSAMVAAGGNIAIAVRANDSDTDSMPTQLRVVVTAPPAHGTAVADDGSVRYTPNTSFSGADAFEYRLVDEMGVRSEIATVSITVTPPAPSSSGSGGGGGSPGKGGGGRLDLALLALLSLLLRPWKVARGGGRAAP